MKKQLIATVLLIFICALIFGNVLVEATTTLERNKTLYKYYTSIEIKTGDSLWSIAKEYNSKGDSNVTDYIEELKSINGLNSDTIHSGQYLTVVYYSDEFK